MANFYGNARTNYFRVKDVEAFKSWVWSTGEVRVLERIAPDGAEFFGFASECPDSGCFPNARYDEELGDNEEIDWAEELSQHLVEGEVAVMMECGAEKLRYLSGWSRAIYSDGRDVWVSMDDIYAKAAKAFNVPVASITEATY